MSDSPQPATVSAWARLFRASKLLLERAEGDLKKAGLPPLSWYDVLYEVHSAPGGSIRQFELGQRVLLPKYNLSRLLDRLANEGLVDRSPCADDKRGTMVTLTAQGRALLKRMWKIYGASIQRHFEERVPAADIEHLAATLKHLID